MGLLLLNFDHMERRKFIQHSASAALLLLANGNIRSLGAAGLPQFDSVKRFRFAVTSDGHYGQEKTSFVDYYERITTAINNYHKQSPLQFTVANGDLIHDNPIHLQPAADALKKIATPLYVTKGNHDQVSDARWQEVWGIGVNHAVEIGDNVLLLGTTSDDKGTYLAPDADWFEQQLKEYRNAKNIFIFLHITPVKWTQYGVDGKEFQKQIKECKNIRAVFNGHDHDQDGVKMLGNIPFLFDGHFGGGWGTAYRGFRVVELLEDNSMLTYMMSPDDKLAELNIYNTI